MVIMEITKKILKIIIRRYMIQHDLDFMCIKSSLDCQKNHIKMVVTEDKNENFSLN